MAKYLRKDVHKLLKEIEQDKIHSVYLICGDRTLCRQAADDLLVRLLPDETQRRQNLTLVDGEQENPEQTLAQLRTFSLFPGRRVIRVKDTKLFYSKSVSKTLWEKAQKARDEKKERLATRYLTEMLGLAGLIPGDWHADHLEKSTADKWKSLFGFPMPSENMAWAGDLLEEAGSDGSSTSNVKSQASGLFIEALEKGIPAGNILIMLAEAVDRRSKLFKAIDRLGVILDLSVDSGFSKAATEARSSILRDLIKTTLQKLGKKIEPQAIPILLDRVGFHPDAVVLETEKLALYCADRETITRADLDAMVGRTREEAIFEFTEAFTDKKLDKALLILTHMLEQNAHPLMILAGLHNHIRRFLRVVALQAATDPAYSTGMNFNLFQKGYLPLLKEQEKETLSSLPQHPYALYMLFRRAESQSYNHLTHCLAKALHAEFLLKSSPLEGRIIMEDLLYSLLLQRR